MSKRVVAFVTLATLAGAVGIAWFFRGDGEHAKHAGTKTSSALPASRSGSTATPDPVAGQHWEPNRKYVYSVELTSSLTMDESSDPVLELSVRGGLSADVTALEGGRVRLFLRLTDVHVDIGPGPDETKSGAASATSGETSLQDELARPYALDLEPTGLVQRIHLASSLGVQPQQLLKSLSATFQLVEPTDAGINWESTENDTTGRYLALYHHEPRARDVSKQKLRYLEVAEPPARARLERLKAEVKESGARFELAATGAIERLTSDETIRVVGSDVFKGGTSRTRLTVSLLRVEPRDPGALRDADMGTGYFASALSDGPSKRSQRDVVDQEKIGGMSFEAALRILDAHASNTPEDRQTRYRTFLGLEALFRQQPDAIAKALARIRAGSPHRRLLIDALGQSGSPSAQAELRGLVADTGVSFEQRADALLALRSATEPAAETMKVHEALLDDPALGGQAHVGLGSLVKNARDNDLDALADQGASTLLGRLQKAQTPEQEILALKALGNTGHPMVLDPLVAKLADVNARVRAAAVDGLRFVPGAFADSAILGALEHDPDTAVRLAAAQAFGSRDLAPEVVTRLGTVARTDPSPAVRHGATELLLDANVPRSATREALQWVAQNDSEDANRALARRGL